MGLNLELKYMEDKTSEKRPPEDFYAFVRFSKNKRSRLIVSNEDIFIIWGQNGLLALVVILSYMAVWLLKLGQSEKQFIKYFIYLQRFFLKITFIKLQFVAFSELTVHNINTP